MKNVLRNLTLTAGSLLAFSALALAQGHGGGGHGGGGEEGAGNNLSFPTIFAEGIGIGGEDVTTSTGLREATPPATYNLSGEFWYGWLDGDTQMVCNPAEPECPPAGPIDEFKIFVQNDENNVWQSDWLDGRGEIVNVSAIDWGDNLESQTWWSNSIVRVELALLKDLDTTLTGHEMWYLEGQGPSESWGVRSTEMVTLLSAGGSPALEPYTYESSQATIYSPCVRLTIQKMEQGAGDFENPPTEGFQWNSLTGAWDGMYATILNKAVYESNGSEGPSAGVGAEVNVKGRLIYGYNWRVRDIVYPQGNPKTGWYRLTFSLDGTDAEGKACSTFGLNTTLASAAIVISEEEVATDEGEPTGYTPIIDSPNNLTYMDVFIQREVGSGGGANTPPVCDAGVAYEQACTGLITNVFLSGANSSDLEDELGFTWTHDCEEGVIDNDKSETPVLGLVKPGAGQAQSCLVTLTVKELGVTEPQSATCSATVDVDACSLDCLNNPLGGAVIDQCGVCDGNNECFDCFNVPFGTARLDRCNICDGDGTSCLGCFPQSNQLLLQNMETAELRLRRQLVKAIREIRRIRGDYSFGRIALIKSAALRDRNLEILGEVPTISQQCTNALFCDQVVTSENLDEHLLNARLMYELVLRKARRLRINGNRELALQIRQRARELLRDIETYSQLLPTETSNCD